MLKKVIRPIMLLLMGAVLTINLLTMTVNGLGLQDRLNWLPGAFLSVSSGSMEPVMSEGDLLFVWETPYDRLKVGDLVTFHRGNELVTHQIIREEEDMFVTLGVANNVEDAPIGPEEYCARVALIVPGGAALFEFLTSPERLLLLALFVLAVFYGPELVYRLARLLAGEGSQPIRVRPLRLMSAAVVISTMCIAPFVTAAKYTANINEYASVTAGATYLTSNYLSEEGNTYTIEGWNGLGYGISLHLYNYENELLFNEPDVPVLYQIEFRKLSQDPQNANTTYNTNYSVILYDGNGAVPEELKSGGYYGPYAIAGTTQEPLAKTHFEVVMAADNEQALPPGTVVRFQIIVNTISNTDFDRTLTGDFTFVAASAQDFLNESQITQAVGSALVTYRLTTEQADGPASRDVRITWDTDLMYLNEYEPTAANAINDPNRGDRYSAQNGYLILTLRPYSSVKLQFFKYDANTIIRVGDIVSQEMEAEANAGTS